MPAAKNLFHQAAERVLMKFRLDEMRRYMDRTGKSAEEADAWFTTRKSTATVGGVGSGSTSELGFESAKERIMPHYNKTLLDLIVEDPSVVAARHHYKGKLDRNWFNKRRALAWVTKGRMTGPNTGKRKIGEVTAQAAETKNGSAVEAFEKGEGLVQFIGSQEKTIIFLTMLDSLAFRGRYPSLGLPPKSVTTCDGLGVGCFGPDSDVPHKLALERINELLAKAAKQWGTAVDAITNGMKTDCFLSLYDYGSEEGLKELEEDCRRLAKEEAEELHLHATDDSHIINARGSEKFVTAANLLVTYKNIVQGLKDSTLAVIRDKDRLLRFFIAAGKKMKNQRCIGTLVQNNIDPEDFEKDILTTGFICVEQFPCVNLPGELLVINLDAKKDDDQSATHRKKIPIPGGPVPGTAIPEMDGTGRYARAVSVSEDKSQTMTTFRVNLPQPKGAAKKHWTIHRLIATSSAHCKFGLQNDEDFSNYLELKDGQTFEDVERFKYHQAFSERSIRALEKRFDYLKKKGWDNVDLAKKSDLDHCLGRSMMWMNSNMFLMFCSHSWNRSMSYVRIMFGCWGFAFGHFKYVSGND